MEATLLGDVFFLEPDLDFRTRDFVGFVRSSCLVALLLEVTNAASFPAALPIVAAAFIKTPFVSGGATFFFAMRSNLKVTEQPAKDEQNYYSRHNEISNDSRHIRPACFPIVFGSTRSALHMTK